MSDLLATGLAHHQAGRLAEAERCYRELLSVRPEHADALHLLGLLAFHAKNFAAAISLIARATEIAPSNPVYHYNLGIVLRESGRREEAAARYRDAVRLNPQYLDALVNLAVVLTELRRPAEAVTACDRAIAIAPDHAAAHFNRGNANRGLRRFEEAQRDYASAIRFNPNLAESHANRGVTLGELERWDEAVTCHERAVTLRPTDAGFHYNLGIALRATGHPDRAIACYDRSLELDPTHAKSHANRANALLDLERVPEALEGLNTAVGLTPNDPEILYNRGVALETAHQFEAALADYRRALAQRPAFAECAHNLSLTLLLLGRFEEAWPLHEWRFHARNFVGRQRGFAQPLWTGEALHGRTLLIHAEQGFGDTIQFSRYAAAIKGGRVILEVPRALLRLMTGLPGVDQLVAENDELPPFDLHCPILSLPAAFGTTADTIPPPSRLIGIGPAPALPAAAGPRIGIAWSGNPAHHNDRNRSMPSRTMLPLLESAGLVCALQTFMHDADRETLRAAPKILDLGSRFRDFADTAAAIMALDIVVSVDTSIAHLAATLGKPTWILLPFRPEWRWQLEREDSPWYPSVRLFRQREPGDWAGVIARVSEASRTLKNLPSP